MAQNVIINGVTYENVPRVDIPLDGGGTAEFYDASDATASAGDILSGKTAYGASGKVTGNIATKTSADLQASGATVTAPAGYYASSASKAVASGSATTPATTVSVTPSISVNSSTGVITASVSGTKSVTPTVSAGYVSSGTAGTITVSGSGTEALTTQAAQTITPGTSDQTIAAGTYLTGAQTILGDADLISANIKSGANIFGVSGSSMVVDTTIASLAATAATILSGYKAYVNGSLLTGEMNVPTVSQDSSTKVLTIS